MIGARMDYFLLFGLLVLSTAVKIILIKLIVPPISQSDESFHILLINRIKWNKHRFIKRYRYFLFNEEAGYPQLFHWILSFLPMGVIKKNGIYISLVLDFIFHILCIILIIMVVELTGTEYTLFQFTILSIVLMFSPHILDFQYSQNSGLTTRSFGIILGLLVLGPLLLYFIDGNFIFLCLSCIAFALVILSSQI